MNDILIIQGVRTPIGRMGGALASLRPEELAAVALKGLIDKTRIDPSLIDDIIIGHACSNNAAVNIARWASLKAGIPCTVPAQTVERQCGSSLQTLVTAAANIKANFGHVYVSGGCESWSTQPYLMKRTTRPFALEPPQWLIREVGPDPAANISMGLTAELLAEEFNISREEQDVYALRSQQLALAAIEKGYFDEEIAPVSVKLPNGETVVVTRDEHPRSTSLEKLAKLRPAFKEGGSVTAGNSSGLNDGAVALLLMSRQRQMELAFSAMGKFLDCSLVAVEPRYMGIAPALAIKKVLRQTNLALQDMDVVECNEAFASQTLAVMKILTQEGYAVDPERWNPNGGAIAFGHPNGMSGGRLVLSALRQLARIRGRYALVTLCIGGGQGIAAIFERE